MRPRRRQRRLVRAVVYVLVALVVIGMILTMVGSALSAAAVPSSPAGQATLSPQQSWAVTEAPATNSWRQASDAGRPWVFAGSASPASSMVATASREAAPSSRPAPVVVLGTGNLTWSDLQAAASQASTGKDPGSGDAASAAAHLLAFASQGEPMNLAVRTPADRTCSADAWLTLGRGTRASAVRPTNSCTGTTTAIPADATPLVRALKSDTSVLTVGPQAQLATGAARRPSSTSVSSAPSPTEALSAGATLTLIDTAVSTRTDAERIVALDGALRTVQEQARPGTRIVIASLADDEDPGPQMAVLPPGTTSTRGSSSGLIVGTSTHRPGLAQLTDLTPTLTRALAGHGDPNFDGQALNLPATGSTTVPATDSTTASNDTRISRLADDALHARASQHTVIPASALLIGLAAVLLVGAALMLRSPEPARRSAVRRRVAWTAICLSAMPIALLLVNALPWWHAGAQDGSPSPWAPAVAIVGSAAIAAGIVGLAAGIAMLVQWRERRRSVALPSVSSGPSTSALDTTTQAATAGSTLSPSLPNRAGLTALLVAAAIPLTWLADAAAGAHLAFNNPLGMNAVVAGRFYGVSNTAFALISATLVVTIAAAWEALGRGRRTALILTGLLGGATLVVDGAPQLGADVGGALTLVPTLAFLGAGLARLHLSWRRWLAIGATTVIVVTGFAVIDLLRPGRPTHLGRFARQVADGSAVGVLGRKAYALVGPFVTRPGAAAGLACALVLVTAALWWLHRQLRAWRAGTSPYAWLAPTTDGDISRVGGRESGHPTRGMSPSAHWATTALRSLGVLTLVSVLVNDSGITMAGFILAAAAPPLLALALLMSGSPQRLETSLGTEAEAEPESAQPGKPHRTTA